MSDLTNLLAKHMAESKLPPTVIGGDPAFTQLLQEAELTRQFLLALSQQVDALLAQMDDLRGER